MITRFIHGESVINPLPGKILETGGNRLRRLVE
jgi:hypothetical protein